MQYVQDILADREQNYILPFYWQQGNHYEKIPEQIETIYKSGAKAFCVESRVHPAFCRDEWWRDMDLILAEAQKRDMRVWVLDDNTFPTGNANGIIREKYPHLRKWQLVEKHIDVIGPMQSAALLMDIPDEDNILLGAYAYPRPSYGEELLYEPIKLTDLCCPPYLCWDIPAGVYRVFFLYKSRNGSHMYQKDFLDTLRPEAVHALIEEVYEPHYARYHALFGSTFAGFFSDEPSLGNSWGSLHTVDPGMYAHRLGTVGLALPFHDSLCDVLPPDQFPALWFDMGEEITGNARLRYMEYVTKRYRDCFTRQLSDWCHAHQVAYIGHIIEDMNAHARLGCSTGHYFRTLDGQDMSGMDIVLHQILPGFADHIHTSSTYGGIADPAFFQYVMPKMCASLAHGNDIMHGKAMCEVFGAYGWAEGVPMMKWLMDFLLVRGINHFVPHAFSPVYPNPDCPPHFGAEGHDPQFDGFSALMRYANKVSHLFQNARHVSDAAILYHAEGEWMNRDGEYMLLDVPAKLLYDAHLDFDIVPADMLTSGDFLHHNENFRTLVVPYAKYLPKNLLLALENIAENGVQILFVDNRPDGTDSIGAVVEREALAGMIQGQLHFRGQDHLLRHYHAVRDDCSLFMFFNESVVESTDTVVTLPCKGDYLRMDLLQHTVEHYHTDTGRINLRLKPYQSCILVFGDIQGCPLPPKRQWTFAYDLTPTWSVSLADTADLHTFTPYTTTDVLFPINDRVHLPDFAGIVRYTCVISVPEDKPLLLDLGEAGQTVRGWLNGMDMGIRICKPYRFDLTEWLKQGENELVLEVANTLGARICDPLSRFIQIPPVGLLGPVKLYTSDKL